jgi:hypothetical protein
MAEVNYVDQVKSLLSTLNVEVYSVPVSKDDTICCLCRLKPLTPQDTNLKAAEGRLLYFIERALKLEVDNLDTWRLRLSRPWILKEDKLYYTWDFTFQGNLRLCIDKLKTIAVPPAPLSREGDVAIQNIKPARGSIKQVRVGNLRA